MNKNDNTTSVTFVNFETIVLDFTARLLYDESQHRVTLTKGFLIGIHPVTQACWQEVMGNSLSHFKGDDLPVEYVSWEYPDGDAVDPEGPKVPDDNDNERAVRGGAFFDKMAFVRSAVRSSESARTYGGLDIGKPFCGLRLTITNTP